MSEEAKETSQPEDEFEAREAALVESLKEKHKVSLVHVFTASTGHTIYCRMPDQARWRRFRAHMNDERKRNEAAEVLLRSCLLHPAPAAFDAMLDAFPGLLDTFANKLVQAAGLSGDVEKKVL